MQLYSFVGIGVVVPVFVLAGWSLDGLARGLTFASLAEPLRHTVVIVAVGSLATLAFASGPAWFVARRRRATERAIEALVVLSGALPGVLVGFGLLLAALAVARWSDDASAAYAALVASGAPLALGYAARFVTEAYGPLTAAVGALDPRTEECARTLGAPRRRWLARVALPALAPGLAAAWTLVAVALVKELPVTLLLGGAMGLRPLSFRVYDRYQEAFLHDAGLAGLLMVAVATAGVAATLRWRRHV